MLRCHRCIAGVESLDFWGAGWITLHVWKDGATLNVCPDCQSAAERREADVAED